MSDSLQPHGLYSPWNSPGQNTGVGSLSLLQGIFPTQGLNPGLPHCRWLLYQLSHKGSPRILEWVAYPFSRRSSQPRNRTRVSCIAGRFFTNWAMREAQVQVKVAQSCLTLCDSMEYSPWNSPGQNTGVGSLSLLQGIFPTQGSNPGLPHCRWILYQLSHKGSLGQTILHCCDVLCMAGCPAASLASPLWMQVALPILVMTITRICQMSLEGINPS